MAFFSIYLGEKTEECAPFERIGGYSLLTNNIEYPKNPRGENLILLMSIQSEFINAHTGFNYPKNKILSVFSTYSKDDYFLDIITYLGDKNGLNNIKNGYTKVIMHDIAEARKEHDIVIPAMKIKIKDPVESTEYYIGSAVGANALLLQNEKLDTSGATFFMPIYSSDFPQGFDDILYLSDALGYLFIDEDYNKSNIGIFFVQTA